MRVLNNLDDWLAMAQSETVLQEHKRELLDHTRCPWLTVNMQKSVLIRLDNTSVVL